MLLKAVPAFRTGDLMGVLALVLDIPLREVIDPLPRAVPLVSENVAAIEPGTGILVVPHAPDVCLHSVTASAARVVVGASGGHVRLAVGVGVEEERPGLDPVGRRWGAARVVGIGKPVLAGVPLLTEVAAADGVDRIEVRGVQVLEALARLHHVVDVGERDPVVLVGEQAEFAVVVGDAVLVAVPRADVGDVAVAVRPEDAVQVAVVVVDGDPRVRLQRLPRAERLARGIEPALGHVVQRFAVGRAGRRVERRGGRRLSAVLAREDVRIPPAEVDLMDDARPRLGQVDVLVRVPQRRRLALGLRVGDVGDLAVGVRVDDRPDDLLPVLVQDGVPVLVQRQDAVAALLRRIVEIRGVLTWPQVVVLGGGSVDLRRVPRVLCRRAAGLVAVARAHRGRLGVRHRMTRGVPVAPGGGGGAVRPVGLPSAVRREVGTRPAVLAGTPGRGVDVAVGVRPGEPARGRDGDAEPLRELRGELAVARLAGQQHDLAAVPVRVVADQVGDVVDAEPAVPDPHPVGVAVTVDDEPVGIGGHPPGEVPHGAFAGPVEGAPSGGLVAAPVDIVQMIGKPVGRGLPGVSVMGLPVLVAGMAVVGARGRIVPARGGVLTAPSGLAAFAGTMCGGFPSATRGGFGAAVCARFARAVRARFPSAACRRFASAACAGFAGAACARFPRAACGGFAGAVCGGFAGGTGAGFAGAACGGRAAAVCGRFPWNGCGGFAGAARRRFSSLAGGACRGAVAAGTGWRGAAVGRPGGRGGARVGGRCGAEAGCGPRVGRAGTCRAGVRRRARVRGGAGVRRRPGVRRIAGAGVRSGRAARVERPRVRGARRDHGGADLDDRIAVEVAGVGVDARDLVAGAAREHEFALVRIGAVAAHPHAVRPLRQVHVDPVAERAVVDHGGLAPERRRHVRRLRLDRPDEQLRVAAAERRAVGEAHEAHVVEAALGLHRLRQALVQRLVEFADAPVEGVHGGGLAEVVVQERPVARVVADLPEPVARLVRRQHVVDQGALLGRQVRVGRPLVQGVERRHGPAAVHVGQRPCRVVLALHVVQEARQVGAGPQERVRHRLDGVLDQRVLQVRRQVLELVPEAVVAVPLAFVVAGEAAHRVGRHLAAVPVVDRPARRLGVAVRVEVDGPPRGRDADPELLGEIGREPPVAAVVGQQQDVAPVPVGVAADDRREVRRAHRPVPDDHPVAVAVRVEDEPARGVGRHHPRRAPHVRLVRPVKGPARRGLGAVVPGVVQAFRQTLRRVLPRLPA